MVVLAASNGTARLEWCISELCFFVPPFNGVAWPQIGKSIDSEVADIMILKDVVVELITIRAYLAGIYSATLLTVTIS